MQYKIYNNFLITLTYGTTQFSINFSLDVIEELQIFNENSI